MKLDEYLDRDLLRQNILDRYVRMQSHPILPLNILNYTNRAQIDGHWEDVTRKCRGLIYNVDTEEVLARPFEKFFNNNQPEAPAWALWNPEDVRVQDKMDGSLGILYPDPSQPTGYAVATRGSFASDQALEATKMLNVFYADKFEPMLGVTYLVEIIYPENRIVVDYGPMSDLILLDILENETGGSLMAERLSWPYEAAPFNPTMHFTINDVMRDRPNAEGYVITNVKTNERVKVKFEEYKRLHKLLTGVSSKTVWELLSKGENLDTLLDTVPDEFYEFVRKTATDLRSQFDRIFTTSWNAFLKAREFHGEDRKSFALYVKDSEFKDIYFGLLDDKDVAPAIWKRLKPEHAKPFWNVDENVS